MIIPTEFLILIAGLGFGGVGFFLYEFWTGGPK